MLSFYDNEVYNDFQPNNHPRLWQKFVIKILLEEELNDKVILDVGSGSGFILKSIQSSSLNLHALDLSPKCVTYLNTQGIEAKQSDISFQKFPYCNNFFDYVIFTEVIEHLAFPDNALHEIFRVLKHGGKLVISTHNPFNLYMRLRYLGGTFPTPELDVTKKGQHIRLYNNNSLKHILKATGFESIINKSWFSIFNVSFNVPNWLTPTFSRHFLFICIK